MVKHIILWKLSEELSAEEKEKVKAGIKEGLEGLVGKVPGLLECKVNISGRLDSSNCDVMLCSRCRSRWQGKTLHRAQNLSGLRDLKPPVIG